MSSPLLRAEGLGKAFPAASNARERLSALLRVVAGRPVPRRWAVRDVSIEIAPGSSLGVIGENGAGKSTLLKLLTGVLTPSAGSLQCTTSVGALLELGAGFDPERSGRENIALSAGLMGWSDRQVREREAEIIEFADIGDYIDAPVKHYSSGMVVRLGFAIVAAVKPALLITDEVLAVGDESFQKKCIRWMDSYLQGGGTLLLVSHSMYHVQKLCKTALWLRDGQVEAYGEVFEVTQSYLAYHERLNEAGPSPAKLDPDYAGQDFRIVDVRLNGEAGELARPLGEDGQLQIDVELYGPDERLPHLCYGLVRADGTGLYGSTSEVDHAPCARIAPHRFRYRLRFDLSALLPGEYAVNLHAMEPEAFRLFDTVVRGFLVRGKTREVGVVRVPHTWS